MSKKKKTEKKQLVENKRVRFAIGRVVVCAVLALVLLYLSGISVLTLVFGAKSVDTREGMSKSAIQSVTGEYMGTYGDQSAAGKGYYGTVRISDGLVTVICDEEPKVGDTLTATGFVSVLDKTEREALFAWYEENGDFENGEEYFDNVSPMAVHSGYGRFFPILPSKIMITLGMVCAIYIILIYMGISSGKYGENK